MTRSNRSTLIVGLSVLAVAAALSARPDGAASGAGPRTVRARVVRVAPVEIGAAEREVRLPGVTRAARRATVSFTVPARIARRPVEVGDRVRKGQVLAVLDDREFRNAELAARAAVAELGARREQARRDLERNERLAAARAATGEELEQTRAAAAAHEAGHAAATVRLEESRRLLREGVLTAPFDATVTAVHLEPGEWAGPGAPVVELSGSGAVEVEVEAPETVRARIATGSPVTVELPFLGAATTGRVTAVAGAASGPGGLFPVVVALDPAPGVIAGLAADVVLTLEAQPELTVPLGAVIDPGSARPSVFRIADGVARRVPVQPGRVVGDRLAVRAELFADDLVAVSGHTSLADHDSVEVR